MDDESGFFSRHRILSRIAGLASMMLLEPVRVGIEVAVAREIAYDADRAKVSLKAENRGKVNSLYHSELGQQMADGEEGLATYPLIIAGLIDNVMTARQHAEILDRPNSSPLKHTTRLREDFQVNQLGICEAA